VNAYERWAMGCCEAGFPQRVRMRPNGTWTASPLPKTWEQVKISWKAHQLARTEKAEWSWERYRDYVAAQWWASLVLPPPSDCSTVELSNCLTVNSIHPHTVTQ
jgi:hypothetical protein